MPRAVRIWRQMGGALIALGGGIGELSTAPVLCIQRSLPLGAELADPTLFQPQRLQPVHGACGSCCFLDSGLCLSRSSVFSSVIPHLISALPFTTLSLPNSFNSIRSARQWLPRIEQGCFASSWNVQNTLSDPGSRVFSCNAARKPSATVAG
jgi:hypothetical protein